MQIGLLLFSGITQFDLADPVEVFSSSQQCDVHLIWENFHPVVTGSGWFTVPTRIFTTVPFLDMFYVPGGAGQIDLMQDDETLVFIERQVKQVLWIALVCNGFLVLGPVGLLKGYRKPVVGCLYPSLGFWEQFPLRSEWYGIMTVLLVHEFPLELIWH